MPYDSHTDEELAALVKKGDDEAFSALMGRSVDHIFNFVRQYIPAKEDAEDVVQDSFFKAWKHIRRFKRGRKWKPWLFTVARNTALDHIKKKKAVSFSSLDQAEDSLSFADTLEDAEPLPSDSFADAESAALLKAPLAELPADYQSVITLHYRDELTFEEIAEVLDKPMNTVKSWHRRALIKLRGIVDSRMNPSKQENAPK